MTLLALILAATFTFANPQEIRMQPTGTEPITACGIVRTSGEVLATGPCESGAIVTFTVGVAERPGAPDALVRAFAENEKGRTLSADSGCLDSGEDCERQCGDVNGDGKFSLADFALARKYALTSEVEPDEAWCDVDGDATCTLRDFERIRGRVAGDSRLGFEPYCPGKTGQ